MAQPHETVGAEGEQYARRGAVHDDVWNDHFRRQRHGHDDRYGNEVSERNRHDGAHDRCRGFFLEAERDGEKPAHSRVDAVIASQEEEREPNVAIAHNSARSLDDPPESSRPRLIAEESGVKSMRLAICGFTVAALLGGCGSQTLNAGELQPSGISNFATGNSVAAHPRGAVGRDHRPTWISPDARKERQLLFVSDNASASVAMFSLPKLDLVGAITGFAEPQGLCADGSGHIWVADTAATRVYEYSRSGVLLNTIWDYYGYPVSCAINPRNGELTVLDIFENAAPATRPSTISGGWAPIEVYACPSCSPVVKEVPGMFYVYFGAYDNHGNLYVDGLDQPRTFQIGVVPRGKDVGHELKLSGGKINFPGMVQWYGPENYLAVGDQKCNGEHGACVNWVSVSGARAKITGQTNLENAQGAPVCDLVQGVLDPGGEKRLLGGDYDDSSCGGTNSAVSRWRYPAGGLPINSNESALQGPIGSTVSVK